MYVGALGVPGTDARPRFRSFPDTKPATRSESVVPANAAPIQWRESPKRPWTDGDGRAYSVEGDDPRAQSLVFRPRISTSRPSSWRRAGPRIVGNLFYSTLGAWEQHPQALDLVGLARESAAVVLVAFWLTNGLRPVRVHPVRLWLKRGLLCR